MEREYVISSAIDSVGCDELSETLEIEFCSGGVYREHGKTPLDCAKEGKYLKEADVFKRLQEAASHPKEALCFILSATS